MDSSPDKPKWVRQIERRRRRPDDWSLAPAIEELRKEKQRRSKHWQEVQDIFAEIVPEHLRKGVVFGGISRGVLRLAVPSSAHKYELRGLLAGGVTRSIIQRSSRTLSEIKVNVIAPAPAERRRELSPDEEALEPPDPYACTLPPEPSMDWEDAVATRVPSGPHAGETLGEVYRHDPEHLEWLRDHAHDGDDWYRDALAVICAAHQEKSARR